MNISCMEHLRLGHGSNSQFRGPCNILQLHEADWGSLILEEYEWRLTRTSPVSMVLQGEFRDIFQVSTGYRPVEFLVLVDIDVPTLS